MELPDQFQAFSHDIVIGSALVHPVAVPGVLVLLLVLLAVVIRTLARHARRGSRPPTAHDAAAAA